MKIKLFLHHRCPSYSDALSLSAAVTVVRFCTSTRSTSAECQRTCAPVIKISQFCSSYRWHGGKDERTGWTDRQPELNWNLVQQVAGV